MTVHSSSMAAIFTLLDLPTCMYNLLSVSLYYLQMHIHELLINLIKNVIAFSALPSKIVNTMQAILPPSVPYHQHFLYIQVPLHKICSF